MRSALRNIAMTAGVALAVFSGVSSQDAAAASVTLQAGTYQLSWSSYALCSLPALAGSPATFIYSGAGKPGSVIAQASASSQSGINFGVPYFSTDNSLLELKLPSVPAAGPGNWSGSFTESAYSYQSSNGKPGKAETLQTSGTFTFKLAAFTPASFHGTLMLKTKDGNCTAQVVGAP